jgi:hypothetical protein
MEPPPYKVALGGLNYVEIYIQIIIIIGLFEIIKTKVLQTKTPQQVGRYCYTIGGFI